MVGSAFADIFWLIQEAGLSFYSYQILSHTLRDLSRVIFLIFFWLLMLAILALRLAILATRLLDIQSSSSKSLQYRISYLHVGYFATIALIESWSSFFLIRLLHKARDLSPKVSSTRSVFRYLLRTTELRLASLCAVGVTRAVTYSWQVTAQSARFKVWGWLYRFLFGRWLCRTLFLYFPQDKLLTSMPGKAFDKDLLEPAAKRTAVHFVQEPHFKPFTNDSFLFLLGYVNKSKQDSQRGPPQELVTPTLEQIEEVEQWREVALHVQEKNSL
ncbi:hypothetical protein N8T08_002571 [Aspergillus melleus]|uniref:Uncharacterized protein n=1 Tax=Aspergillus melleus TaxID=138277 RepID=A0ACC3B8M4_9EURO|nr:hypothetical protein N8T08_002571 [Aspergillus melleus]